MTEETKFPPLETPFEPPPYVPQPGIVDPAKRGNMMRALERSHTRPTSKLARASEVLSDLGRLGGPIHGKTLRAALDGSVVADLDQVDRLLDAYDVFRALDLLRALEAVFAEADSAAFRTWNQMTEEFPPETKVDPRRVKAIVAEPEDVRRLILFVKYFMLH